jgi:ankyrin repeat protein
MIKSRQIFETLDSVGGVVARRPVLPGTLISAVGLLEALNVVMPLNERNVANVWEIDEYVKQFTAQAQFPEINKWLQSNLRKFLINDYPEADQVTKLPDPTSRDYQAWMDAALQRGEEIFIVDVNGVESEDFTEKVTHVVDYFNYMLEHPDTILRDLKVNDLTRISVPEAIKKSEQWTSWLINQSKAGGAAETVDEPGTTTIKVYGNGYRWVEVTSEDALNREGSQMGHCVGSYASQVEAKQCIIYSLRDEKNEPHVTIEVRGRDVNQIKGKGNQAVVERYHDYVISFLRQGKKEGWISNVRELGNVGGVFYNGEIMKRDDYLAELRNQKPLLEYPNRFQWRSVIVQDDVTASFTDINLSVPYSYSRLEDDLLGGKTSNSLYVLRDTSEKTRVLVGVSGNRLDFVSDGSATLGTRGYYNNQTSFSEEVRKYCFDLLSDLSKKGTIGYHSDTLQALGVLYYENNLLTREEFSNLMKEREPKRTYPGGLEWTLAVLQEELEEGFDAVGISEAGYGMDRYESKLIVGDPDKPRTYLLKDSSGQTRALIAVNKTYPTNIGGDGRDIRQDIKTSVTSNVGNMVREQYWPPCYDLLNELYQSRLEEHSELLVAVGAVLYQDRVMSRDEFRQITTAESLVRKSYGNGLRWINLFLEEDISEVRQTFGVDLLRLEYSLINGGSKLMVLEDSGSNPRAVILINHSGTVTIIRGLDTGGKVETKYWSYCYDVLKSIKEEEGYLTYSDQYNRSKEYENIGGYLINGELHTPEEAGARLLDVPDVMSWPSGIRWIYLKNKDEIDLEIIPYKGKTDSWSLSNSISKGNFYSLRDSGESSRVIAIVNGSKVEYLRGLELGGDVEDSFKPYVIEFLNNQHITQIDGSYLDAIGSIYFKGSYLSYENYEDIVGDPDPVLTFSGGLAWYPVYTVSQLSEICKTLKDDYKFKANGSNLRDITSGKDFIYALKDGSSVIGALGLSTYGSDYGDVSKYRIDGIAGIGEDGKEAGYGDVIRSQDRGYFYALLKKLGVKDFGIYEKSLNAMKVGDTRVDRDIHSSEIIGRIPLKDYPNGFQWEILNSGLEIKSALKEMKVRIKSSSYSSYYSSSDEKEDEQLNKHEEDVANKKLVIYCLRDRQDRGQVIIFLNQQSKKITAIRGRGDGLVDDDFHHYVLDFLKKAKTAGVFKEIDEKELLNAKSVMFDNEVTHRLNLPQEVMLVDAVINHDLTTVKKAMDDGIDPDIELDDGNTLIVHALLQGDLDIADELLNNGAHLENRIGDYGDTLLMHLIRQFHRDQWYAEREKIDKNKVLATIKYILKEGEDPNDQNDSKETALIPALLVSQWQYRRGQVTVSDYKLADLLFQYGASADYAYTKDGDPLLIAAFDARKDLELVMYLAKHGASGDVQERTSTGKTALMRAIESKKPEALQVIDLFLSNGSDIEASDDDGRTPLWYAVSLGKFKVAQYLLDKGANPNPKMKSGASLLELAQNIGAPRLLSLLQKAGAH